MLDDRYRYLILSALIAALALAGVDFGRMSDRMKSRYSDARESPAAFSGREVVLSFSRVQRVESDRFYLRYDGEDVEIVGRLPGARRGDIASVRGAVRGDLAVVLAEGYLHRGRRLKWFLAAATLLVVGFLVLREGWRARVATPNRSARA